MKGIVHLHIMIVIALCVSSCRTVREAERVSRSERVQDTLSVERWHAEETKDSVHVSDSMSVEYRIGIKDSVAGLRVDTLFVERWHTRFAVKTVSGTDKETKRQVAYRTVKKNTVKTIYKEKTLGAWRRMLMRMGGVSLFMALVLFVLFIKKRVS